MDECDIPMKVRGFGEKVKEVVVGHPTGNLGGVPASVPGLWNPYHRMHKTCVPTGTEAGAPPRSFEGSNKPARPPALQRIRDDYAI